MTTTQIVLAIIIGIIISILSRPLVPDRQPLSLDVTVEVGIIASLIGMMLSYILGVNASNDSLHWLQFVVQATTVLVAVIVVTITFGWPRE
jgi:uncharacterized membrane protein YeaQ/YmgE (transglycosylase-associated protein family)